jgi:hypothetical protein
MHRSSESIAALAAALAKAQVLLTNPEKSLSATVATSRPWASTRSPPCRRPPSTRPRKRSR